MRLAGIAIAGRSVIRSMSCSSEEKCPAVRQKQSAATFVSIIIIERNRYRFILHPLVECGNISLGIGAVDINKENTAIGKFNPC